MPEKGGDRVAMSRALGAAFLNHQVEQLEKSVINRGPSSGNWRDRRQTQGERNARTAAQHTVSRGGGYAKRAAAVPNSRPPKKDKPRDLGREVSDRTAVTKPGRRIVEDSKDADVVIIDASVLIHALGQLKKWCKPDRKEVVVVPLEALNTLDLLKKGTSALSQRARAASRVLEAQVGTNPRICVQRDDAFVSWEDIAFKGTPAPNPLMGTPEWLRRTIACARWEAEHLLDNHATDTNEPFHDADVENSNRKKNLVFAVVAQAPQPSSLTPTTDDAVPASPVPLPTPHANKFEPRATGTLVAYWAARAGVELYEVQPTVGESLEATNGRRSEEEDTGNRAKKHHPAQTASGRGRRGSHNNVDRSGAPPGVTNGGGGLVERPPAVMAMMEMVAQPSRVVRVLARGEKLDPDT